MIFFDYMIKQWEKGRLLEKVSGICKYAYLAAGLILFYIFSQILSAIIVLLQSLYCIGTCNEIICFVQLRFFSIYAVA